MMVSLGEYSEGPGATDDLDSLVPESIFRAYDIRGIVHDQLNTRSIRLIGQAIGTEALDQGIQSLLFAWDGRVSSPELSKAVLAGILDSGCNVVSLGLQPTPILYFATHTSAFDSGVMLTASHNPANYNGLKVVFNKTCLADNQIAGIRQRIMSNSLSHGSGKLSELEVRSSYIDTVCRSVSLAKPLRIVVDCGNAVPAVIAPDLFAALGCEVIRLYCELDGSFPNHHPDPTIPANLEHLATAVLEHKADLGVAFDGDGDRLGLITNAGKFVDADKLLMLLVESIADQHQGESVVFDVKCSSELHKLIAKVGMQPVMHRSGHSFMKQKMLETEAPIGGEYAAHVFIQDRWFGFDDGVYTAVRIMEVLAKNSTSSDDTFARFTKTKSTGEIKVFVEEHRKFELMTKIERLAEFPDANLITLDGLRVEFVSGWGLVRASNTSPALLLRFEADSKANLEQIKSRFKALMSAADNSLLLDF